MAYPVVAAAVVAAAGAAMDYAAQRKAQNAMNDAQQAERIRQRGYEKEAQGVFNESLAQSGAPLAEKQLADAKGKRLATYEQLQTAKLGTPAGVGGASGNRVVGGPMARDAAGQAAAAKAWQSLQNQNAAKLASYGDWTFGQNLKNSRALTNLGVTSTMARGSARVLPIEMQAASRAGDELKGWANFVRLLGSVASAAGAAGGGAAGAGADGGGGGAAGAGADQMDPLWDQAGAGYDQPWYGWS